MKWLQNLVANSGQVSKFAVAIVSAVLVNMHTGWTDPTGIITDAFALLVYLVPNAGKAAAGVAPTVEQIVAGVVAALRTDVPPASSGSLTEGTGGTGPAPSGVVQLQSLPVASVAAGTAPTQTMQLASGGPVVSVT